MMATSPQVHAQAHAAALAAVQAQMSLQQGHAADMASPNALYSGWQLLDAAASYNPAHSLQQIVPSFASAMAANLNSQAAGSMQPGPQQASMLSPPSRCFGVHLRYATQDGALCDGLDSGVVGSHGVLPLLQTPTAPAHADYTPMAMSFQPSSISTYQAALAAAGAAIAQQAASGAATMAEQPQHGRSRPPRPAVMSGAAARVQTLHAHGAAALPPPPGEVVSGDGSVDGTPGKERPPSTMPDSPNPSDWDPLWRWASSARCQHALCAVYLAVLRSGSLTPPFMP
jgi:hypothetical protein